MGRRSSRNTRYELDHGKNDYTRIQFARQVERTKSCNAAANLDGAIPGQILPRSAFRNHASFPGGSEFAFLF